MRERLPREKVIRQVIERHPGFTLRTVRQYARAYADCKDWPKDDMYLYIRNNFVVDDDRRCFLRKVVDGE